MTYDEPLPMVHADPERVTQLLSNLVGNALKFTPAGGRVDVGVERQGDGVMVSVIDTGSGIPADQLPYVFDRFYQVSSGRKGRRHGAGLGLTIARGIVEAHGGTISIESAPGSWNDGALHPARRAGRSDDRFSDRRTALNGSRAAGIPYPVMASALSLVRPAVTTDPSGLAEREPAGEEALVARARRGDVDAFERLYHLHAGRVHALCLRLAGEPTEARELVQDTFIKAWEALPRFRGEASLATWLHRHRGERDAGASSSRSAANGARRARGRG